MKRSLDSSPARTEGNTPILSSLNAPVSPPRRRSCPERRSSDPKDTAKEKQPPSLAAIEAGQIQVTDHVDIFSSRVSQCVRQGLDVPCLQLSDWMDLYRRNEHGNGRHFVIHQHDHPVAGPHYDLRLQFSETSSVSWSVMYGLPGDPNSRRVNRNATETRVHSYWVIFISRTFLQPRPMTPLTAYTEPCYRNGICQHREYAYLGHWRV